MKKQTKNKMMGIAILYILIAVCCLFTSRNSYSQGAAINSSGTSADNSAILDVSSTTQGVLISRMTEAQRNAIVSPAFGLMIMNTTTGCFNFWLGNTWKQLCGDCDFNSPIPGNNGPICQGSTLNLTATTILGATYQWSGPNGFTSTLQNPVISNASATASGSYSVTATKNGCTSTPQSTVALVNATPVTPTAGNSGPVCVGALLNLTASTIVGATYSWTGPNGYSASVQNPIISSSVLTHAGTYNVIATVNGCASAAGTTSVSIITTPAAPGTISGPAAVCPNSTGNVYSITAVMGATSYNWTMPSGATITAGGGTNIITITFGGIAGNITVSASNACGTSSTSAPLTVLFNPVVLDATSQVSGTTTFNTFTINTTYPNEIILVAVNGCYGTFNGSVNITDAGSVTQVPSATADGIYANMALFACVSSAIGSHTINVTWGSNWYYSLFNMAYAVSYAGFCSTPTIAANVQSISATGYTTVTTAITPATANSCLFADYYNHTGNPSLGTVTWTNDNLIRTDHQYALSGNGWDGSIANTQLAATSAVTVTATDNIVSYTTNDTVLMLVVVHP